MINIRFHLNNNFNFVIFRLIQMQDSDVFIHVKISEVESFTEYLDSKDLHKQIMCLYSMEGTTNTRYESHVNVICKILNLKTLIILN